MHLYNAWLPAPVAAETQREAAAFAGVVKSVKDSWRSDDPDSVYATLKWISLVDLFIKAKSEVSMEDVKELTELGIELFHASQDKLYAQVRWGTILIKLLKKHGKKITIKIQWRPFYETLIRTHFKRTTGPEGWKLRRRHFETVASLVRVCRKYFPAGSASEIWSEFRILMRNPWHNSSFEGAGFLRLFLPVNMDNQDFFTSDWIQQCLNHWGTVPNCQFWDIQWTFVITRCIKYSKFIDWECFVPDLFTQYLNMFEVPVSNASGSYPFPLEVHSNTRYLFSGKTGTPAKGIAKSIVYLMKPGSKALDYFEKLINLIEQYYHPSNGGRWTYSLERFLRYLVIYFQLRIKHEQLGEDTSINVEHCLGNSERITFVKGILKLIDRGQYSKNESLADTVAVATSVLSYVEPSLVLPFIASRFQIASETMTATHQLKSAVTSVAFAGRAMFLASVSTNSEIKDTADTILDVMVVSLSNALLGMDANDPPKTLATMQLIGSIFSSLVEVGRDEDGPTFLQSISFSEWLDEFFSRLFLLLRHLEPSNAITEGVQTSITSGTFLVEDSPYYFCMLEILLGKLSDTLFKQSMKRIAKFVTTNILPGATSEVGLLCCACVHANPEEAAIHLIKPILLSINTSLNGTSHSNFDGRGSSCSTKASISTALETSVEYQLKILAIAISYGGPALLHYKDELKGAVASAFRAPSWKVNSAADNVLRSLLGSLVLYYPMEQYRSFPRQNSDSLLEEWGCAKNNGNDMINFLPKWHIPNRDEILFANVLLDEHFVSALEDLLRICHGEIHIDAGDEKDYLKMVLLRIYSSLQGVMSCLPDMRPSTKNKDTNDSEHTFLIAGAIGSSVGSSEMRERAAEVMHVACNYLLEQRSDDSILLALSIRIMDALVNFGSLEYEEWSNHIQAWKLESAAIIEPPCNFIVPFHTNGKKRPCWALIDKAYMHNTWRSSQSSYHKFRTNPNLSPSEHANVLMEDLLKLSLHNYETVRTYAGRSLLKMLKRWPAFISKCVLKLTGSLRDQNTPEHEVLGSCMILSTQTVLRHFTTDAKSFSSFVMGLLASSHHESLKAQKAITELFVKYNINFSGISRSYYNSSDGDSSEFESLISHLKSLSLDASGLHWRYNLMAGRILLLLTLASKSVSNLSLKQLAEIAGHFLKDLNSQLPQSRMLAISALNTLLQGAPNKFSSKETHSPSDQLERSSNSSLEGILSQIFKEEGFFTETLNSLSHIHIIADSESAASKGNYGASSFQSSADKAITFFYFDFSATWPRTPSWISLLGGDTFYSSFARIFKRLIQECGTPVLRALQKTLEDFSSAKERSKQCVAAEALAGILHSDVNGLLEAWGDWIMPYLQKVIVAPTVESIPDWAACIRYAVTGKGKYGARIPLTRQKILDCLRQSVTQNAATSVIAKRYAFISAALIEVSPQDMSIAEVEYHYGLAEEIVENMTHPSAQVREVIGILLAVLLSNLRLNEALKHDDMHVDDGGNFGHEYQLDKWVDLLTQGVSKLARKIQGGNQPENGQPMQDITSEYSSMNSEEQSALKRMETMFHFVISSLKSGRSSFLLDIVVRLLYPIVSLQEISNKELATLAKASFELLKWRTLPRPILEMAVSEILSSVNDPNWRTRVACLTFIRVFVYRHTFSLTFSEKVKIWKSVENLLADNQVEVREHASSVLSSLMKGGDEDLSREFRERAFLGAQSILKKQKQRNSKAGHAVASTHGAVLALTASVLSVPYDMPSWLPDHVTLLARFIGEPSPIKSTVTKAIAEFRRTHADTWNMQKDSFTDDQLEVLADMTSSSSYFA